MKVKKMLDIDNNLLDRITQHPDWCAGRPCIRGMRIRVHDILKLLAKHTSFTKILEDFPDLELEDIQACLVFASLKINIPGDKTGIDDDIIISLYSSLSSGFAGEIGTNIRGIQIDYKQQDIIINCYFDGEISEEELEKISDIETDFICAMWGNTGIFIECIRVDYPQKLPMNESTRWFYLKKENL